MKAKRTFVTTVMVGDNVIAMLFSTDTTINVHDIYNGDMPMDEYIKTIIEHNMDYDKSINVLKPVFERRQYLNEDRLAEIENSLLGFIKDIDEFNEGDPIYRHNYGYAIAEKDFEAIFDNQEEQFQFMFFLNSPLEAKLKLEYIKYHSDDDITEQNDILIEQSDALIYYTEAEGSDED